MRQLSVPLLVAAVLLVLSSLAWNIVDAAPAAQSGTATVTVRTTSTVRATATTEEDEDATATPDEDADTTATPGEDEDATATPDEDAEASATPGEDEDATATPDEDAEASATPGEDEDATATPDEDVEASATPSEDEDSEGTPTPEGDDDAEATATPEGDADAQGEEVTAITYITATATITATEVITGSVLPARLANPDVVTDTRTLTAVGVGEVTTAPDVASVSLGAESIGDDLQDVTDENNELVAGILDAIEELGVPSANVQTSSYSIYLERPGTPPVPVADPEAEAQAQESEQELIYHVSQQVTVRIDNLDQNLPLISELIRQAVDAGANNVYGPNFQLADDRELQQRARRAAVEDAYARAQDWATLTGVEIIGVATVSEVIGSSGSPTLTRQASQEAADTGLALQAGSLTYSEQVQVVFYIR